MLNNTLKVAAKNRIFCIILTLILIIPFYNLMSQTCRTPGKSDVVVFDPAAWDVGDHSDACILAAMNQGYPVIRHYDQPSNPGNSPSVTLTQFINELEKSDIGILRIESHANSGGFVIEFFEYNDEGRKARDDKFDYYKNKLGIPDTYISTSANTNEFYGIFVKSAGISYWASNRLKESLVYVNACKSSGFNSNWKSLVACGYDATIRGYAGEDTFFKRMNGTKDRTVGNGKRSAGDASKGINHLKLSVENSNVVLSPVIIEHSPAANELVNEGQVGYVEFDSQMDTNVPADEVIEITGSVGDLSSIQWINEHRIGFRIINVEEFATIDFRVHAHKAVSMYNKKQLDGNNNPNETDGVGPNGDFYSWTCRTSAFAMMDFEDGSNDQVIRSTIPGMEFITTQGYDWVYGDKRSNEYNIYPYREATYWCDGNCFAWLGPNQGQGRINFTGATATSISMGVTSGQGLYVDAYDKNGRKIDSDHVSENLNTNTLAQLRVSGSQIDHVIIHDSGNYWLIDNLTVVDLLQQTLILLSPNQAAILESLHTISAGLVESFLVSVDDIANSIQLIINWLNLGNLAKGSDNGNVEFSLSVFRPDGTLYGNFSVAQAPYVLDIRDVITGDWKFQIEAISLPESDFPFATVVSSENESTVDCFINSDDILFYPNKPKQGTTANISAIIHSSANSELIESVSVRCYLGDVNGTQIDNDDYVINLANGNSDTAYFRLQTSNLLGEKNVQIVIDQDNNLFEFSETNNSATAAIEILPYTKPKLTVSQYNTVNWDETTGTWDIEIELKNDDSLPYYDIVTFMSEDIENLSILSPDNSFGTLAVGDSKIGTNLVTFDLSSWSSDPFTVKLNISCADEYGNQNNFEINLPFSSTPLTKDPPYIYPNPLNPLNEQGTIRYKQITESNVSIKIYDVSNDLVKVLLHKEIQEVGIHTVIWDGKNEKDEIVANGVYFVVVSMGDDNTHIIKTGILR